MKLLMHICCSNCSLYPLKSMLSQGIEIRGFWFNPNIHPLDEYQERLHSLQQLQKLWSLDVEYHDHYGITDFMQAINNRDTERCVQCYTMRLEETAKTAKKMGLDGFTTSLLVSPYQGFDALVSLGRAFGNKYSVPFYAEDFRTGYKSALNLSKELGLYRQRYCGCIYSQRERDKQKQTTPPDKSSLKDTLSDSGRTRTSG